MKKLTTVEQVYGRFANRWFTFVNSANNLTSRTFKDSDTFRAGITCFRLSDCGKKFDQVELRFKGRFPTPEATFPNLEEMQTVDVRVDQPAFKFLGSYEELEPVLGQFIDSQFVCRYMSDAVANVKAITRHCIKLGE